MASALVAPRLRTMFTRMCGKSMTCLRVPAQPRLRSVLQPPRPPPKHRSFATSSPAADAAAAAAAATTQTGPQNVVSVLEQRGLLQDLTSADLGPALAREQLTVYVGFDPTADSLHLGNLLAIIVVNWFQKCGHNVVVLLGGATGRVGDPSGKKAERPVMSLETIEHNVATIGATLRTILSRSSHDAANIKVVNNFDWYGSMGFLDFLRNVGKYARMGTMLNKESVKLRLGSADAPGAGMSFTEFTYQLLQGYDFVHLCREEGVRVQVGGSDQWGNITAGTDLVRKLLGEDAPQCFGLTFPLLIDSEGKKFGKSEGGAVWLAAARLSPYKFYQHLFATTDADVVRFLKMLTFLPLETIEQVEADMQSGASPPNTAQRLLAEEVTRFVHGQEGVEAAQRITEALKPGAETELDADTLEEVAGDGPSVTLPRADVLKPLVDVLVATGMQKSKGAARRLIEGGGVYKNNGKVSNVSEMVEDNDLLDGRLLLLAAGKKNKLLVRIE